MAGYRELIFMCTLLLIASKSIGGLKLDTSAKEKKSDKEELIQSESKDGKLEIIKRIKKINEDGSYTIGYEADDGSFKIESRDVLGHIKGTYGFLDDEGQIKRVSYSSSNSSEIITKPETPSVVQRIPTKNKVSSTTRRSTYATQTTSPTTLNPVIQNIARRRVSSSTTSTTTTTQKPNYSSVIGISKTTSRPGLVTYASAPPRVLLQGRPLSNSVTTTATSQIHLSSEGQLIRPEVATVRATELPILRRLALKNLEDEKPVHEEPESQVRGNILRRQLGEGEKEYNLQEHLFSLQQSMGHDSTDVYSSSVTTGTPRPLFTTTTRPRPIQNSQQSRAIVRYPINYQPRNIIQENENGPEYVQETTTTQPIALQSTPTAVPIVQIPANKAESHEPLIAIRHPFQRSHILVPLSQFQGQLIPVDPMEKSLISERQYSQKEYVHPREEYYGQNIKQNMEVEQEQAIVRRLPPPPLRPIPVQVDQNGYIKELPRQVPTPYPIPIPVAPVQRYSEINSDIDSIEPPVSTREFQKLLQQLIIRQSRLEKISTIAKQPDFYMSQGYRRFLPTHRPYFIQRVQDPKQYQLTHNQQNDRITQSPREYVEVTAEQKPEPLFIRPQNDKKIYQEQYDNQSFRPNRRVARLLPRVETEEDDEEYLPPDVREMLLLKMLQLAINPALPVEDSMDNLETATTQNNKKSPVRNVEILGEEDDKELSNIEKLKSYKLSNTHYK